MEVDFVVVDEISEGRSRYLQSSCSLNQQSTAVINDMATTAGPRRLSGLFQETSSLAVSSSVQLYNNAELSFANQPRKVRINKRRVVNRPLSPPKSPVPTLEEQKRFSAQVAPLNSGSFGTSDSLPRLKGGMIICPHLHKLPPDTCSTGVRAAVTSVANGKEQVAVHTLDTRSSETASDECWSPLSGENTEPNRIRAASRFSASPPPLPEPQLDSSCEGWSACSEDPQSRVLAGEYSSRQQESLGKGIATPLDASGPTRPLHRPLTRQWQRLSHSDQSDTTMNSTSPFQPEAASEQCSDDDSTLKEHDDANVDRLFLIAPDQDAPLLLGKTKPVPPPKTPSFEGERQHSIPSPPSPEHSSTSPQQNNKFSSSKHRHHSKILQPTVSNPAISTNSFSPPHCRRVVSFRHCKAGEEHGQFRADYLGSKEVDSYVNAVNSVAKQLVEQRPAEVVAYVSSQKIRLAPPKNEAVLFKSFAVKDILMVEKCTINKRIIGIIVWKSKMRTPTCHILRCPDEITSKAFYEAAWEQTQIYDDITLNKAHMELPSSPKESPRHGSHIPPSNGVDDSPTHTLSSSSIIESSSSSNGSTPSYHEMTGFSATQVLHKFPASYVGEAVAGKLHSMDDVIQKVLTDKQPTQAKELFVCLSLAEVRYVEVREDEEVVCMAHETSRIRAIGVYSQDRRFMGYIIKEEGKPLMSYVLRCNSAGLMVSLMSFLRQSCQLTSYQRGGSFYDELAADDVDDCDYIMDGGSAGLCDSLSIVRRIRSLTATLSQRTNLSSSSVTRPSFQSHTQVHKKLSPAHDVPQRRRDSIQSPTILSPFDFTDEDYAKFRLTYVGSASLDPPLTRQSVVDAMNKFSEHGTAAGQAAKVRNSVSMQVSALGINLSDKTHKLFVNRNYPRKQLEGYCSHPTDDNYFAFASRRPGFWSSLKVHVFKRGSEPVEQILDAIHFWLEIDPITY